MYISVCNIQKEMRLLMEKKKTPQGYFIKICIKFSSYEHHLHINSKNNTLIW